ncbi:cytochrome o ubiquinol oxidase subunit I, partial [Francisella tularensis subsp. holarctica]|nr:cytochrome o ubiquinol oxidase subunit I [Francisella tularensis subsp. holarctica]
GILLQIIQIFVSIKQREQNRVGADAWGYGRTLEWGIHSPVPFYNFSHDPVVEKRDADWDHKQKGLNVDHTPVGSAKKYEEI